jgi:S-adenosylmethionine hydrolase
MRPLITLTTDFGEGSPYVAQMKGVILSICREVDLVDVSHAIRPQDVRQGALALADATPRFPAGTIHIAVVDPGVGTSRRVLYAEINKQHYIAPDNGLLSRLLTHKCVGRVLSIENHQHWLADQSHTFHGRDIMAPVAAHLAAGLDPTELGPSCESIVSLPWPHAQQANGQTYGEVLIVDSFGNLITNIEQTDLATHEEPTSLIVSCGGHQIRGIVTTYGAAMHGEIIALFDSQGRLEIAVVGGNAASRLKIVPGAGVIVSRESS